MNRSLAKETFSVKWWLCSFEFAWMLFKTMDKAAGLCIPEIGTTVQSMWALLSATYLSSPLHSETRNTILRFLYSASVPLGRAALVSSVFSLSTLLFFISFSPSLFLSFSYLERPNFQRISLESHHRWNDTRQKRQRGILLHCLKPNSHDVFCSVQHKP